ncbi:pectinesterase-like [Corylus avellana]|uniref:pectinesterase-like n=1 Tax=Corylus avellana TaxID=13451 RepID=UPI00286B8217|nr:pectinesterase-like [Corylus avellana]
MIGKVAVSVTSVILVVGVALAVVAVVHHNASKNNAESLSPQMKMVKDICSKTDYLDACQKSLSPVAEKGNTDPKEFIKAAIQATINEVSKSANFSDMLVQNASNIPRVKMAAEDCKELMSFSIDELQASFTTVGESDLHTMNDRADELKNWLSAVISYQQTCLDGFEAPEYRKLMEDNLNDAASLTSNCLAIVSELADILKVFGLEFNIKPPGRRLLSQDGFPTWFSASDRKLLASVDNGRVRPNAIVAKDGSGQFKSIAAAVAAYPKNHRGRYVIYVKSGVYNEYITIEKNMKNVFMFGDGPRKTIVTGRKSNRDGFTTFKTASFSAIGEGFICKSMGFQNTAGPEGHQAVALRVQSDMSAFFNCRMDGYQDTLYVQAHRQLYRNCVISGTVDFIFGDSSTVIQNSLIIARKPMDNQQNTVTAQGRADKRETTGLVIHNCRIVPEQKLYPLRFKIPTYLGRPWKEYARTVIMETTLADFIQPLGYLPWAGSFALSTCSYFEYANRGPGSRTVRRVRWKNVRVISRREAIQFTAVPFLQGNFWLKATGFPFLPGLRR